MLCGPSSGPPCEAPAHPTQTLPPSAPHQRLDDLAHDHLAAPVKPVGKRRALLANSWVLLLAAGMLAIIIVSKDRLHVAEALQSGEHVPVGAG